MAEIKVVKEGSSFPVKTLVNPVHIIGSLCSKRELILQFTQNHGLTLLHFKEKLCCGGRIIYSLLS